MPTCSFDHEAGREATRGPKPGARVRDMDLPLGRRVAPFLLAGATLLMITKENTRIGCFSCVIMKLLPTIMRPAGCGQRDGTGTLPVTACLVGGRAEARHRRWQIVRA